MLGALQAAGYSPDQITMVFLTHLHRDHIGGLREAGAETFAKARYAVNATEYDFWVSDARGAQLQTATIFRCWSA